MATPSNLVQIAFSGGVDESVTSEALEPASAFRVLQNVRQNVQGGFDKRLGTQPLSRSRLDGSTRSAGRKLFSLRGAPCVIDGGVIDSYVEPLTKSTAGQRVSSCTYRLTPVPAGAVGDQVADVETCNGFIAIAYTNGRVVVVDASFYATVSPSTQLFAGAVGLSAVSSCGGRYFIFCASDTATSTQIRTYLFDTLNPGTGWTVLGATITNASGQLAMCSSGTRAFLCYSVTGNQVSIVAMDQSGVVDSTSLGSVGAAVSCLDISPSTNASVVWIAASTAANVTITAARSATTLSTVTAANSSISSFSGLVVDKIAICPTDAGPNARLLAGVGGLGVQGCAIIVTGTSQAFGTPTTNAGVELASKATLFNGRIVIAMTGAPIGLSGNGVVQNTLVVVDATDVNQATTASPYQALYLRPLANLEPGLALSAGNKLQMMNGDLVVGFSALASRLTGATQPINRSLLARLDFNSVSRWPTTESRNNVFIGGALLSVWDGSNATELGFLHAPRKPTTSLAATGITGTFRYVAVYEDVDAAGQYVVSGVSAPSDLVTASNQQITIQTCAISLSARVLKSTVRVAFYRTASGGAAPYYRVGSSDNVSNVLTAGASIVEAVTDAVLTAQPKLYAPTLPGTAGESLDRRAPPGLVDVASYNGMIVGIKGDSVLFSGQPVYGESAWFNPVFEIPITGGGDFVALDVLDGTLFLFKSDRVFAVAGSAPSDNAGPGGLGDPRLVASDVGCINLCSVVSTSAGIFFQSSRGIELLDRSGTVTYVGFKVRRTMSTFPVITSAVLDARNSLVRFSLATSTSAGSAIGPGVDLVFDLKTSAWMTDDKSTVASQDAAMVTVGGVSRYAWLSSDGFVNVESLATDVSAYLDGSTYITRIVETSNFHSSGVQGTQQVNQVMLLERRTTDHDTTIALAYNYETSFRPATTYTAASILANLTAGWPVTQLKHQPHDDATCQAIRVRITDVAPSSGTIGNGKGAAWLALTLDITPMPGVFDVPDIAT